MTEELNTWGYQPQYNPFTDEFVKDEIKFMELDECHDTQIIDGITLIHRPLVGRLDDYLNKNWRLEGLTVPVFFIDGKLWMSLTPMEIQSNYLAWAILSGDVGMGGLGLGYTALRAANIEEVERVVVYEKDPRVVNLFKTKYTHRKELEKIEFRIGDVRKEMINQTHDMVWMDIYPTQLSDDMLTDYTFFQDNNDISEYHFWTEEKILLGMFAEEIARPYILSWPQQEYFKQWQATEESKMYEGFYDTEYLERASEVMGFV
jgi:hypothetical protein